MSSFVTMCFEGARMLVPKNLPAVFGEAVETYGVVGRFQTCRLLQPRPG